MALLGNEALALNRISLFGRVHPLIARADKVSLVRQPTEAPHFFCDKAVYRKLLMFFGTLDVFLFLWSAPQALRLVSEMRLDLPFLLLDIARLCSVSSLLFSAYGFLRQKKWAFYLYYAQFPFHFLTMRYSFGFLNLLPSLLHTPALHWPVVGLCIVFEFARLSVTITACRLLSERRASDSTADSTDTMQ